MDNDAPSPAPDLRHPQTLEELQSLVKESSAIAPASARKALAAKGTTQVSLEAFQEIIEYQPDEYTITVQAGTPIQAVQSILAEKGQYLPFDPPFAQNGATIGSMIAKGCSGPGAYRYGILRDFILGVSFVDGLGELVKTGGKVVKNAAGFDVPKLMVGSCGSLGIITEASFKVFPLSPEQRELVFEFPDFSDAHQALVALGRSRFTLDALDLDPRGRLSIRLAGQADSMEPRIRALESLLGRPSQAPFEERGPTDLNLREYPENGLLVKIPTAPAKLAALEAILSPRNAERRYSIGGHVCWIHWKESADELSSLLEAHAYSAQVVCGEAPARLLGAAPQRSFYQRLKTALDPNNKFIDLYAAGRAACPFD